MTEFMSEFKLNQNAILEAASHTAAVQAIF